MQEMNWNRIAKLSLILVACLILIFIQRPFLPLWARYITAFLVVMLGMWLYYAWAKPQLVIDFTIAVALVVTIEGWLFYFILHGLVLHDMDTPGMFANHLYLNGVATVSPFVIFGLKRWKARSGRDRNKREV